MAQASSSISVHDPDYILTEDELDDKISKSYTLENKQDLEAKEQLKIVIKQMYYVSFFIQDAKVSTKWCEFNIREAFKMAKQLQYNIAELPRPLVEKQLKVLKTTKLFQRPNKTLLTAPEFFSANGIAINLARAYSVNKALMEIYGRKKFIGILKEVFSAPEVDKVTRAVASFQDAYADLIRMISTGTMTVEEDLAFLLLKQAKELDKPSFYRRVIAFIHEGEIYQVTLLSALAKAEQFKHVFKPRDAILEICEAMAKTLHESLPDFRYRLLGGFAVKHQEKMVAALISSLESTPLFCAYFINFVTRITFEDEETICSDKSRRNVVASCHEIVRRIRRGLNTRSVLERFEALVIGCMSNENRLHLWEDIYTPAS